MVESKRLDWAKEFLSRALTLAMRKFGRRHPFVQILFNLEKIQMERPGSIDGLIRSAYYSCIAHLKDELGDFNLTHLSLWGDYVIYVDKASPDKTRAVVKNIRSLIKVSDDGKGPDGGMDGDYSLALLSLTLYVLQSSETMADEAEKVTKELLVRLDQRKLRDGGKLEGDLFINWKDAIHTLGNFCYNKRDYHQAIGYLEDFCSYEIADERDILALETLQECYLSLGRDDDAKETRQWWMYHSQRLLQKHETGNETEPVWREEDVNGRRERDDYDDGDRIEEEESETTIVNWVDKINEESLEEDIPDQSGDLEAEIQLVQDQMAELQQRLDVLKGARRRRGGAGF
jgi:hypothetical protein